MATWRTGPSNGSRAPWRTLHRLAAVAVLGALLVGCGDDVGPFTGRPVDPSSSVPFSIEAPDGFDLVTAGRGNSVQAWGEDCCGTDEPYTVLAPEGALGDGTGVIIVTTTGFTGQQGGLAQSNRGYIRESREELTVDGQPAHYYPGEPTGDGTSARWADLTVQRGADVAVGVGAETGTREDLMAVADRAEVPGDRLEAPLVVEPPGDLRVVGSVDADLRMALFAPVQLSSDHVPGSERSHAIAWSSSGSDVVAVSLPPGSVDVAALAAHDIASANEYRPEIRLIEVGGRSAASFEFPFDDPARAVLVDQPWGAVVVSANGADAPSLDVLADLAASAQAVDADAWDAFVIEATGGPGLHPDDGRVELARGEEGGIGWLLQTGPGGEGEGPPGYDANLDPIDPGGRADPCLKLSTRERACASGGGGDGTWIHSAEAADEVNGLPPFTVVTTDVEGDRIRMTVDGRTATAKLAELPGGTRWGAVVFIDPGRGIPYQALCRPRPDGLPDFPPVRIDVLDESGAVVGCVSSLESLVGGG